MFGGADRIAKHVALRCGLAGVLAMVASSVLAQGLVITEQLERAAFRAADLDGDGMIDEAELALDVIEAFTALDANGDGVVEPSELIGVSETAFARADFDGNGRIGFAEVRLRKLEAFTAADRDGDGMVSMAEMLFRTR
jgi:hypothetical protein